MRILFLALSMIFTQAWLAPCMADALGRTTVATNAAVRLCPGDHCLAARFASRGAQIEVFESKAGWLRISPYKSTGVPNLTVAEWIRQGDTRATAQQIATWSRNESVNLLATSEPRAKDPVGTGAVRQKNVERASKRVRRRHARRSKSKRKRPSMDQIYRHHLLVSGACDAIIESGKSKMFKGYYFFLCDNDMFYRLLTGEQIWSELRQSKNDE